MSHKAVQPEIAFGLSDMHCHLGFLADGPTIAHDAGWPMLSMTVDPRDFQRDSDTFAHIPNVHVGVGLHPWWIADGTCGSEEVELLCQLVQDTQLVGEIGLDFAKRHAGSEDAQIQAFDLIVSVCAHEGGKILSIHALNSADVVLDILKRHDATRNCTCILHWFSGSSPQLARAIDMGCMFSLNSRMMSSRKGREYAKAIPAHRILLETDLPSHVGEPCSVHSMMESLQDTLNAIEFSRRGPIRDTIASNTLQLMNA